MTTDIANFGCQLGVDPCFLGSHEEKLLFLLLSRSSLLQVGSLLCGLALRKPFICSDTEQPLLKAVNLLTLTALLPTFFGCNIKLPGVLFSPNCTFCAFFFFLPQFFSW